MEIFGFANAVGTGLQLLAAAQGSKTSSSTQSSGTEEVGFASKLAKTFLSSQKGTAGKYGDVPFTKSAKFTTKPEGYYEKFGKPQLQSPALERKSFQYDIPQLNTAVANLVQNAQNQQLQQLMQQYNVERTIVSGRRTAGLEPATLKTSGIGVS